MPERTQPHFPANGKLFCSINWKLSNGVVYPLKFFKASGLFERIVPTVGHFSMSGQSPHVVTPFFNAH